MCTGSLLESSRLILVGIAQFGEWVGIGFDCLLQEPVEEQSAGLGGAAVEPEGVLVEVVAEVLLGYGVVQGAGEPAFEQGGDQVDAGQVDVCRFLGTEADEVLVLVAVSYTHLTLPTNREV